MNKSNSRTRYRSMLSVCVVLALTAFGGIDQANAQNPWTTNGNNIYNSNTGNVGIGTAAPLETLHLFSSSSIFQIGLQGGLNNSGFIGYWNPGGLFLSNNRNIRTGNNFNTVFLERKSSWAIAVMEIPGTSVFTQSLRESSAPLSNGCE